MTQLRLERAATDVLLGLAVLLAGLWRDVLRGAGTDFLLPLPAPWVVGAHVVSAVVLVLLRRRRPRTCAALLAGASVLVPSYAALIVPYFVVRHGVRLGPSLAWSALAVLGWAVGADLWVTGDPVSAVLVAASAAVAGRYARGRAEAIERIRRQDRATQLAEERRRLAAELHDAVTHWVSLVVMQSGSLAVRSSDTAVRAEADGIRGNGVRAMEELQEMVAVLSSDRSGGASLPPPSDVVEIADQAVTAGQDVSVRWVGSALDRHDPAAGVLAAAAREGLANARKHAPGSAVALHVAVREDSVRLLVRNDVSADAPGTAGPSGAGVGLRDLRERVAGWDGTLAARPTPEGGFELDVQISRSRPEVLT